MCLKTTFDSTTNHLNLSSVFLNCLLLELTVIDLISIVHRDTIGVEIAKKNWNADVRGEGGSSVISDTCRAARLLSTFPNKAWGQPGNQTPPDEGGGGSKRANFCGRPLWMAPYARRPCLMPCLTLPAVLRPIQ